MKEKQFEEALRRMEILKLSKQCVNAFKKGIVWESEGIGALYECNEQEKQYIKEIEERYDILVYHMIHNVFEFGECYTMLYVSSDESEWKYDCKDIADGYVLSYVKNVDDDICSEFGTVYVKPSIGGLVRLG